MENFIKFDHIAKQVIDVPHDLPMLPLRNTIAYPFAVLPLVIGIPRSIRLIEDALEGDRLIGLLAMKDPSIAEPQPGQILNRIAHRSGGGRDRSWRKAVDSLW